MEKFMGYIFKKQQIIFIEFVIFLYILKVRELGSSNYEEIYKMRGVFSSLQYEKLSEIFIRCFSHIDDAPKMINNFLKFFY